MKALRIGSLIVLSFTTIACDRIKHETKEQLKKGIDKLVPQFDSKTPDTEFNKKRFDEFIKVKRTSDIKNIYCYADQLGPDSDFSFAFNCADSTHKRIIIRHKLKNDSTNETPGASSLQHEFPWWNIKHVNSLPKFYYRSENQRYYKYYWYDEKEAKAYYFEFDL